MAANTKRLRYDGPADQILDGVGLLTPGEEYELDADFADRVLASSPWFTGAVAVKKADTKTEDD